MCDRGILRQQAAGDPAEQRTARPYDQRKALDPSGIRLGTPALTTRGMGRGEMRKVAELIDKVLTSPDDVTVARVRREVGELTSDFPLYKSRRA